MSMTIHTFVLGPIKNNTYLIVEEESRAAALVDPGRAHQPDHIPARPAGLKAEMYSYYHTRTSTILPV